MNKRALKIMLAVMVAAAAIAPPAFSAGKDAMSFIYNNYLVYLVGI